MIWQLPIGNRDCFLAVEESHRNSASSFSKGEWPLTFILVIFVWKSFAMVLFAGFISVAAGSRLMYHLSVCQMTILDVQTLLKRPVAMRLTNFRTLSTCVYFIKNNVHKRLIHTAFSCKPLDHKWSVRTWSSDRFVRFWISSVLLLKSDDESEDKTISVLYIPFDFFQRSTLVVYVWRNIVFDWFCVDHFIGIFIRPRIPV